MDETTRIAQAPTKPGIALLEPDIPQNTGTILRMAACFGVSAGIIEPAGFPVTDRAFRRAGMDYLNQVEIERHISWRAFDESRRKKGLRLVLATTKGAIIHTQFEFTPNDVILFGRESVGAPDAVHDAADARIYVPMRPGMRSLNIAVSAAIITAEALRQLNAFPQ